MKKLVHPRDLSGDLLTIYKSRIPRSTTQIISEGFFNIADHQYVNKDGRFILNGRCIACFEQLHVPVVYTRPDSFFSDMKLPTKMCRKCYERFVKIYRSKVFQL